MKRHSAAWTTALVLLATGCASTQDGTEPSSSSATPNAVEGPSSATATPKTEEQVCAAQSWPRPVPQVIGLSFNDVWMSGSLVCWPNVRGLAPDGHDVTETKGNDHGVWVIRAITPPPGTAIAQDSTITANLAPVDVTQSVVQPCEWVAVAEIRAITGFASLETSAFDDYEGAVMPSCSYLGSGDALINSSLMLPPSFAVDARAEFELMKTLGPGMPVTGLPAIDAYCATGERSTMLMALLSGGRGYRLMAGRSQTCDQLQKIAQAALIRIPN